MIRAVVDTSVLVRAIIRPQGTVGPIIKQLQAGAYIYLYSAEVLEELADVLSRPRLHQKYALDSAATATLLKLLWLRGERLDPQVQVVACRDPKDNKLLELAIAGRAEAIVTGDLDLLVLNPFEGIPILGPAAFLRLLPSANSPSSPSSTPPSPG